ncbi:type I restriction endonuclease subunit R [Salinibacter pepae]|uniref:type I restriction endonuclease subunit R n=1 Tax=Salinibacter pepae TaxID=3040382 RepID=UPI0021E6FD75|nr:type I restriction endonuclease [Salinibacter pepae]
MPTGTSEKNFESIIEETLTAESGAQAAEASVEHEAQSFAPGGYERRSSGDYDARRCLLPDDLIEFIAATQPREWADLRDQFGEDAREELLGRVSSRIEEEGTLSVLRDEVKLYGCRFKLVYFKPTTSRNPDLQEKYRANVFSAVRQLYYSQDTRESLDLALFLNGLPLFTAELKEPLKDQNYRDAIHQYRSDRDPSEPLFAFKRCLAHFAVGSDEAYMTTRLEGDDTSFLPFNKGYDGGKGNPPKARGYRTAYLWEQVWAPDSVLNLLEHFIAEIEELDEDGNPTGEETLIFPRYHQMRSVRRLVEDAREDGPGQRYLVQHSAGSGKSISIAVLAHQLAFLHDEADRSVFDTVIVVTDRRVLDKQIAQIILQFEQERGVVADIEEGAAGLEEALRSGKQIVVVTLQTFPHVADAIRERGGENFAVIIDEAHSSQTGEYRKHLNDTLSASSLKDAEEEDDVDVDTEDRIREEVRKRGRQPNVSNFAFTATPKPKTLELFGEEQPGGSHEPFDLYTMRQAIEEGFILDVLENYTTYDDYFRLHKQIEEDPEYDASKATRLLESYVSAHEHTIAQKVEIMAEHFEQNVSGRIGGKAKAMIATRSRLHAVRFKQALDRYLDEQNYPYEALVAFSGTVEDRGIEHTERSMNGGIPTSQTARKFRQEGYRFLVVANKFQTGFDEPLLHTMYVDKKLGGVNAVQTLSRLNRTHPGKEETMVLDFENDREKIEEAFEPYYEKTTLSEGTDPSLLYDLENQIRSYGIVKDADLGAFAEIWHDPGSTQSEIHSRLDTCVERYKDASEEEQTEFRRQVGKFVRLYSFLAQVVSFEDVELEKLYTLARPLLSKLLALLEPSDVPSELTQYVDLESIRIQKTSEEGIDLERGSEPLPPQKETAGTSGPGEPEPEPLSKIIELLNERFDNYDFDEDDRVFIERLKENVRDRDAIKKSIEVNSANDARLTFDEVAETELQGMIDKNFRLYKKITDDEAFGEMLFDLLFDRVREEVEVEKE